MPKQFTLQSEYQPAGDQINAIKDLTQQYIQEYTPEEKYNTLLGVTGSGKTYTVANIINNVQKPALIIAPNKTLAAQLFNEFKEFFPDNAVEFFISYYDYYQPESYLPSSDTFIEKTAKINKEIDRLRHAATRSIFERDDVIVIASVSAIYGLGAPESYFDASFQIAVGMPIERNDFMQDLLEILYNRNDFELERGSFRVRGDTIDIFPTYEEKLIRIEFFGDEIDKISIINPGSGQREETVETVRLYPAKHYVADADSVVEACDQIEIELKERIEELNNLDKALESTRLNQRTKYDIEMLKEVGYCNGVENYSRIIEKRAPGSCPQTLIDYFIKRFGKEWMCILDESHMSVPQIRGMYYGDASRKQVLIDYGFRLPCARDNRPLNFDEFIQKTGQLLFVSATPAEFELSTSSKVVEQIVRPTGLVDPQITICPVENQIDDLRTRILERIEKQERILITTLTKKSAEDLSEYLESIHIKACWLHSELKSLERIEVLRDLRLGKFDVLIGVNLLREGLDLPEVSLVAILDADKEGFLRSESALLQTVGRAARNVCGEVIMYANKTTAAMQKVIDITEEHRVKQLAHNKKHNITPQTIKKEQSNSLLASLKDNTQDTSNIIANYLAINDLDIKEIPNLIKKLEAEMLQSAQELEFERAAEIRDQLDELRKNLKTMKSK